MAFFVIVGVAWEVFKWVFGTRGASSSILGTGTSYFHQPPFRLIQATDVQLPHIWDIAYALTEPVQRNQDTTLLGYLIGAAVYTWAEAAIGFAVGAFIGVVLASIFIHSLWAERAFVPYVIASQTIPIVALAPIIVGPASGEASRPWSSSPRTSPSSRSRSR